MGIFQNNNLVYHTWGVITMCVIGVLLPFISIFLYKKRKAQIKTGYATILFILLFYTVFYVYLRTGQEALNTSLINVSYGIILPVIAVIFNILAIVKIKADEKLIRSLDRIR